MSADVRATLRGALGSVWGPIAVGLLLRVVWILLCPNEPNSDQIIYHQGAIDISEGRGFIDQSGDPAGYWPVGYSLLLTPFYLVFGPAPYGAFVANVALSALTIWGAYALAGEWFERSVGLWVAWALALHPTLVFYVTCIASENAFFTGTLWFSYAATRAARTNGTEAYKWVALAGLLAGLTAYVRATIALLGLLVPFLMWSEGVRWRALIPRTALTAALAVLVLLPWSLRNHAHFDSLTPFSLNGSANLWMGNHPGSDGGYSPLPKRVSGMSLPERERVLGSEARRFILENPGRYLELCARRTVATLKSDTIAVVWNERGLEKRLGSGMATPLKLLTSTVHWVVWGLAFFFVGLRLVRSARRRTACFTRLEVANLLALALLAFPFVCIVSGNRYHLPLVPFVVMWSSSCVYAWRRERRESAPA